MRSLHSATLLALAAGACGGSTPRQSGAEEPEFAIVTLAPAGRSDPWPEPTSRYPAGTRLVRIALDDATTPPRELSEGLAAAGGARVNFDGRRIAFVARETDATPFGVWTCAPDGKGRRRAVDSATDCGAADFLPSGRIVYSGALPAASPRPQGRSAWALFEAQGDGTAGRRITFGAGLDLDPATLRDGRIAYTSWLPTGIVMLFGVHPDGTGALPLVGRESDPDMPLRPTQAPSGDLHWIARSGDGSTRLACADWRAPSRLRRQVALDIAEVLSVEPCGAAHLLVAGRTTAGAPAELLLVDPTGATPPRRVFSDPAWDVVHATPLARRPRPQGHLSVVKPDVATGTLLCVDARAFGPETSATVRVTMLAGVFAAGETPAGTVLGEVPLAADGSFHVRVPADRPLLLDFMDDKGRLVAETRTPIWVRPNEVRACVGCHEDLDTAPPNRRPLAALADAVPLDATSAPAGVR